MKYDVIIVGGGISGLACARRLQQEGVNFALLEASDEVGGRARTDLVDGFRLDRGFQVFLTAYPEAKQVLDFDALDLKPFQPGAIIRLRGRFFHFVDPWRKPGSALKSLLAPIGTVADKWRIAKLRRQVCKKTLAQIYESNDQSTEAYLRSFGFSEGMIDHFFRPFLGGVFLEKELQTSSRMFEFVFRMFSSGAATLPRLGMGELAKQMKASFSDDQLLLNSPVQSIDGKNLTLTDGRKIQAERIVLACEQNRSNQMLGIEKKVESCGVTCIYFAASQPPLNEPILVLNGDEDGPINNLSVPSLVSPEYAPNGRHLISVSIVGNEQNRGDLEEAVRNQLSGWYGDQVKNWETLRTYRIEQALPTQVPPSLDPVEKPAEPENGYFICGDHRNTASIHGAMVSGRRTAEAILA